ncbi:hypothetical protein BWD42_16275 [Sphingobacterium sp. CZ-UAM]|uniref:hypothetical protein n=1 Tax=unclassified Sphingobacterium TaxID=2609468 RepID=UPI0009861EFC|nr:hypothetical protein [Sphingobacterium sp. CZ-UAM]OOG17033.1 hypothetical protein BWD42_16275 [Sphingobacterium sp. CZ-UAM]
MSSIIDRILRKKSVRNEAALALSDRLSFGNSQIDHFLMEMMLGQEAVPEYRLFQKKLLLLEPGTCHAMKVELDLLNQYFEIVKRLMPAGFSLKWENRFQPENDVTVPALLLFPMIQNAVANGYNSMSSHPIRIRLSGSSKIMLFEVSHRMNHYLDGQFKHTLIADFQGRLEYLFPERHSLLLNSNSNTCRATLSIHF